MDALNIFFGRFFGVEKYEDINVGFRGVIASCVRPIQNYFGCGCCAKYRIFILSNILLVLSIIANLLVCILRNKILKEIQFQSFNHKLLTSYTEIANR